MNTTFALHPAASKYLIALGVARLPEVQQAIKTGKILVGAGTTNIMVAEQLLNCRIENPQSHVAGLITQGVPCVTPAEHRLGPWCIDRGELVSVNWLDFLDSMRKGDLFIKGANALDPSGAIGILMADSYGGTIGRSIGILRARGIQIITPIGREKLIPSCQEAQQAMAGIYHSEICLGSRMGYMMLSNTTVITEIESLKILLEIDACQAAAGGVGGMEGSVVLAANCKDEEQRRQLLTLIKKANLQPPLKIKHRSCADCPQPCFMIGNSSQDT